MNTDNFDNFHNFVQRMIAIIFGIVLTLIVGGVIIVPIIVFNGCQAVEKHGVKGVVEEIWNGPTNGIAK